MPSDRERVAGDPALLAAVRARYTGGGDVLDQLWWLEHPGEPTPTGTPDPAVAVETARRARYRPGATTGAEDLARAAEGVRADRDAARRAVREALAARHEPSASPEPRRPGRVLAGATVAALLVGAAAGFGIARFAPAPRPAALAVLDRPQREDDRPPATAPLPSAVPRSALRHLTTGLASGTALYGARTRDGRICLVAVVLALRSETACTSDAGFALAGLSLAFEVTVDPADGGGAGRPQEVAPTWAPDGAVRF